MQRLIYQVQWGSGALHSDDVEDGLKWCQTSVEAYADKFKCDYLKFDVPLHHFNLLEKFNVIRDYIDQYDEFMFIDLDVHIDPDAEWFMAEAELQVKQYRTANSLTCLPDGTPINAKIVPPVNYPNTGVMLISQRLMKDILKYIDGIDLHSLPVYPTGIDEGILFDFMMTTMKYGDFLELPYRYNSMVLYEHQLDSRTQSFRHFCGPEGKELLMRCYK